MSSATHDGPVLLTTSAAASGISSSPLTEFYNVTLASDFLFVGITNTCSASVTGGCIRSIDIINPATFPTATNVNTVVAAAAGGTSGITVDNYSSAGQASSVYYVTLTGNSLVKSAQSAVR